MQLCREEALIGKEALQKLSSSHVAVFGLGGVGSYVVEALARAGVGSITVVDDDVVAPSNVNRQLYALTSTFGLAKVDVAASRIKDINPDCKVYKHMLRFDESTREQIDFSIFNYVVDAIDTVTSKLLLAKICYETSLPVISCMGTGNKLNPACFQVADVFSTSVCPLAKVMRCELKRLGIPSLKVVFSREEPRTPLCESEKTSKRVTPSSISFVPPVAGFIAAGEVVNDLIK